jgi:hypothetical protein
MLWKKSITLFFSIFPAQPLIFCVETLIHPALLSLLAELHEEGLLPEENRNEQTKYLSYATTP